MIIEWIHIGLHCIYQWDTQTKDVRGSIFFDPAQPSSPTDWPNPTHHHKRKKFVHTTQRNPQYN